jgi:hypothetical protein
MELVSYFCFTEKIKCLYFDALYQICCDFVKKSWQNNSEFMFQVESYSDQGNEQNQWSALNNFSNCIYEIYVLCCCAGHACCVKCREVDCLEYLLLGSSWCPLVWCCDVNRNGCACWPTGKISWPKITKRWAALSWYTAVTHETLQVCKKLWS